LTEVIWTDTAFDHLEAIQAYIAQFNPRAAHAVAAELITAGDSLSTFPHRGRPVPHTNLRELVSTYPYVIRHRVAGDRVFILRLRHSSRRPTTP
jgi:toxin ParE1/3/4